MELSEQPYEKEISNFFQENASFSIIDEIKIDSNSNSSFVAYTKSIGFESETSKRKLGEIGRRVEATLKEIANKCQALAKRTLV